MIIDEAYSMYIIIPGDKHSTPALVLIVLSEVYVNQQVDWKGLA